MTSSRTRPSLSLRSGLTLVEIMIALTMTLIVLGAMMTAFQFASEQMQMGRAVMEMANRLRTTEELLRKDLSHLTVDPRPYTESTNPNGYFEIVEGPLRDSDYTLQAIGSSYAGDHDDVWMGTVRSETQPFRGRYIASNDVFTVRGNNLDTLAPTKPFTTDIIESPIAEVVWWTSLQDNSNVIDEFAGDSVRVYRRVLLIRPGLAMPAFTTYEGALSYLATTDISARVEPVPAFPMAPVYFQLVANDIKDLANRRNRFCHFPDPSIVNPTPDTRLLLDRGKLRGLFGLRSADYTGTGYSVSYNGNDIMLTDVAAFDVKVYSPNAGVAFAGGVTVEPSDIGFVGLPFNALGAFVDLGHVGEGWFSGPATSKSQLNYPYRLDNSRVEIVYDTWTPIYESDGIDQDFVLGDTNGADQGTNGLDNGGPAAPDDDSERETRPPYPYPVRGVKATIRLVEKNTKQIHQSSVIHSYVPE